MIADSEKGEILCEDLERKDSTIATLSWHSNDNFDTTISMRALERVTLAL